MRFGSAVTTRGGTESVGEQHGCCKGALATASVYCECMRLCQRPLPPLNDLRSELTRPRREPPPRTPLPAPSEPAGGAVPASGAVPEPAPRPSVPMEQVPDWSVSSCGSLVSAEAASREGEASSTVDGMPEVCQCCRGSGASAGKCAANGESRPASGAAAAGCPAAAPSKGLAGVGEALLIAALVPPKGEGGGGAALLTTVLAPSKGLGGGGPALLTCWPAGGAASKELGGGGAALPTVWPAGGAASKGLGAGVAALLTGWPVGVAALPMC